MKIQDARKIYCAVFHPNDMDLIRDTPGFLPVEEYKENTQISQYEIGIFEGTRILILPTFKPTWSNDEEMWQ